MTSGSHYEYMRLCLYISVCLSSSILLLCSCKHSNQEDSQTTSDSLIEKEAVFIPSNEISIKGKWVSKDNSLYPILEFKGKSTVVIKTIMGPFASSYERDEEFIRVRTDKSDLLFEIINEDSIIGSGFAKGVWIKEK